VPQKRPRFAASVSPLHRFPIPGVDKHIQAPARLPECWWEADAITAFHRMPVIVDDQLTPSAPIPDFPAQ